MKKKDRCNHKEIKSNEWSSVIDDTNVREKIVKILNLKLQYLTTEVQVILVPGRAPPPPPSPEALREYDDQCHSLGSGPFPSRVERAKAPDRGLLLRPTREHDVHGSKHRRGHKKTAFEY